MPLPPAVSHLARQTIKIAYDELERTISPADSRDFKKTTLAHVRKAALDIENQLAARQSLRNMRRLMPLFRGLAHYSKVVEILCNGTPFLPWLWSPITLILQIASEYGDAFEQIIKGYASIAESLKRFEILSDTFIRDAEFQTTLAVFYADILQFHKHAYKFVRRSGWRLLFLTSWGRFQRRFDNILEDLKQHGDLIDKEANAINISEDRKMREDIRAWREQSQSQVKKEEVEQNARQYESIASWLKINESDQLAIFESISSEATEHQGTCGWILENPKVRSWSQRQSDTPTIWLQGSAGTGKSVLCTQLANFMKAAKMLVIHHFCTYRYANSTTYEEILRSLVLQLLREDGDLTAYAYEVCVLGKKPPTTSALEQLLQRLFSSMSNEPCQTQYIWIIVDGLDECEVDKQMRLVRLINQVTSKPSLPGGTACKVLIASRSPSTALQRLRKKQLISLTEEKESLYRAIHIYVGKRLRSLNAKFRQLDIGQGQVEEIQNVVTTKADGMFLYARLVMDYLSSNIFYSDDEIKASVNRLPKKLEDFYRKILTQILVQLDSRSVDRVKCILGWVAFAKRPLQKFEFLSAITFSSGDPKVSNLAPQYILDICGTIVEERRDSTLAFIHISVKEFLQTSSSNIVINETDALYDHGAAAVTCLLSGLQTFGNTNNEHDSHIRVAKGIHGFHIYATEYWTEYLLFHSASPGGLDTNSSLFALAYQLAHQLDSLEQPGQITLQASDLESSQLDERLGSLRGYTELHKHVERALKARSLKNLESEILQAQASEDGYQHPKHPALRENMSALLTSYQEIVKSLLSEPQYPGLSAEQLELFKSHFRAAAFTCRLSSCPRATLGFESEKLLSEHELSHIRRFQCSYPSCQYPPFLSNRALRNHRNKYHTPVCARRVIRKVHATADRGGVLRETPKALSTTSWGILSEQHGRLPGSLLKRMNSAMIQIQSLSVKIQVMLIDNADLMQRSASDVEKAEILNQMKREFPGRSDAPSNFPLELFYRTVVYETLAGTGASKEEVELHPMTACLPPIGAETSEKTNPAPRSAPSPASDMWRNPLNFSPGDTPAIRTSPPPENPNPAPGSAAPPTPKERWGPLDNSQWDTSEAMLIPTFQSDKNIQPTSEYFPRSPSESGSGIITKPAHSRFTNPLTGCGFSPGGATIARTRSGEVEQPEGEFPQNRTPARSERTEARSHNLFLDPFHHLNPRE